VRELGEDYGIDMEAELTDDGVKGELLKIQVKSSVRLRRRDAFVEGIIEKRYVEYAIACRYPVILVFIDIEAKEARYIWLQDWILRKQAEGTLSETQDSWVQWIDENAALVSGLNSELKNIARWRGKTQLVLSLLDALRSAVSIQDEKIVKQLVEIFSTNTKDAATHSLDAIVREAALLGNRLYGTREGNAMAATLYELARRFGGKISKRTIYDLVIRGESASRIGINTLGILYDDFFDHISSLGLPEPGFPRFASQITVMQIC